MGEPKYINASGWSEENLYLYSKQWRETDDTKIIKHMLMAEDVQAIINVSGMHYPKGTEIIISIPVRIKF